MLNTCCGLDRYSTLAARGCFDIVTYLPSSTRSTAALHAISHLAVIELSTSVHPAYHIPHTYPIAQNQIDYAAPTIIIRSTRSMDLMTIYSCVSSSSSVLYPFISWTARARFFCQVCMARGAVDFFVVVGGKSFLCSVRIFSKYLQCNQDQLPTQLASQTHVELCALRVASSSCG